VSLSAAFFRDHPVVILVASWLVLAIGLPTPSTRSPRFVHTTSKVLAISVLAAFAAIVIWYTARPAYFDPAEPTITAVASAFGRGQPLYPALDAPERYVHIYGPMLFVVHALVLTLLGPSITASKTVGGVAILVAAFIAYRRLAQHAGSSNAIVASALCTLIFLSFGNATFWTRAEPLLLLSVAVALSAIDARQPRMAAVLLGLATGLAVNLKLTGVVALLPVFVLLQRSRGRPALLIAGGVGLTAAALPFLLPTVSLAHYADYLRLSAGNGITRLRLEQNLEWATVLALPVAIAWWTSRARKSALSDRAALGATGISLGVLAIVGAKPGGGAYHLLPLVPVLAYLGSLMPEAWEDRRARRALLAVAITATFVAVPRQITFLRTMAARDLGPAIADVRAFASAHTGESVAVGYAGTSFLSQARVELVFQSRDYLLDAPAIQEHRLSGLELPAATLQAIVACRERYWLVPRGAAAFDVPSAYWPRGPQTVFSDEFRRTFAHAYEPRGTTAEFDVWACRTIPAAK
jgi:hypothetical protein